MIRLKQSQNNKGFTIIETLLAIIILGIAVTMVTLSFSKIQSHQALEKSSLLVLSVLSEARSHTLSAVSDSRYGVNFQNDQLVLFRGTSYATTTSTNVFTTLNPLVGIRNIYLAGSSTSVVFERLTGKASVSGTLEVYLRSDPTLFKRITITSIGLAEEN